ncbi:MAG: hypothetical protein WA208_09950 [Thermoanaerobaculia bacterium]
MELADGSRVAVIGGGPAGSFASYFLLEIAGRVGLELEVDIYEPKQFDKLGPGGCNHCGGIVSESLVQHLATEGINLPETIVQRGIESYVLHTDVATVRIDTPVREKRIAAVHRGGGPLGAANRTASFDLHLLELAQKRGARLIPARVDGLALENGFPLVSAKGLEPKRYDLVVGAVGVNTTALKLFEALGIGFSAPKTTKTYIAEFHYGREALRECLGDAMHVFLVDMPRVEFAALIPKGEFATLVLLGDDIDKALVERFLALPEVRECLPRGTDTPQATCHCIPRINLGATGALFADRVVVIGDSGVSRLYKDGIGAAYRTAKACANVAVLDGVSAHDFEKWYLPTCRSLAGDNALGRLVFMSVTIFRRIRFMRRGMVRMVAREQREARRPMSTVLWDTFTGSAPYREILLRCMTPAFIYGLVRETVAGLFTPTAKPRGELAS